MRTTSTLLALAATSGLAAAQRGAQSQSDSDASVWNRLTERHLTKTPTASARRGPKATRQSSWSPPSDLATPLKEVWDHTLSTYSYGAVDFMNYGWDQLQATNGTLNYCVRLDTTRTVTAADRTAIAAAVSAQYQKWFTHLYGYDAFPYDAVSINVVGYAVSSASQLQGTVTEEVYTDVDADGIPQCAEACGRFFKQDNDYSGCAAGEAGHYDQSLWLSDGFEGGAGGDWGQRIGSDYFFENIAASDIHILLHEMGHTFGLDDFYDWTPTGITNFIMLAGSATVVTEFDYWMLRNWWYELSRYRGWQ